MGEGKWWNCFLIQVPMTQTEKAVAKIKKKKLKDLQELGKAGREQV